MTNGITKKFHGIIHLEKFFKQFPYFMGTEIFALTDQTLRSLNPSFSLRHFYEIVLDMQ